MEKCHSVIITCYNKQHSIEKSIESVVAQLTEDFELVVIDDFSSDGSLKIIERHQRVCNLLVNSRNLGILLSTIKAIQNCNGKFITLLDGDDIFVQGSLNQISNFLVNNPNSVIYTRSKRISSEDLYEFQQVNNNICIERLLNNKEFVRKNLTGSTTFSFPKHAIIDSLQNVPPVFVQDHIIPLILAMTINKFYFSDMISHLAVDWPSSDHVSRNFPQINHDSIEAYWFRVIFEESFGGFYNRLIARLQLYRRVYCTDTIFGLRLKMKFFDKMFFLLNSKYAFRIKNLAQRRFREKFYIKYYDESSASE